jgi:hypothetical protein
MTFRQPIIPSHAADFTPPKKKKAQNLKLRIHTSKPLRESKLTITFSRRW